jgi:hypothetical protein
MSALPEYARAVLASAPPRGGGLNVWIFSTARMLTKIRRPVLTPEEIAALLREATAGQPLQRGEIERAVRRTTGCAAMPGHDATPLPPKWPEVCQSSRAAVIAAGGNLADLWESSPFRVEHDAEACPEIMRAIFGPGDPLVCVGKSAYEFDTKPLSEWRGLASLRYVVPSPMSARRGLNQDGELSAHALDNTGPRRFLIVEQDEGTLDEQAAVLMHLAQRAPLALAVHSGGESIHGWFACAGIAEDTLRHFFRHARRLGADFMLWTKSQFTRLPGGRHKTGKRQSVFYFNREAIRP